MYGFIHKWRYSDYQRECKLVPTDQTMSLKTIASYLLMFRQIVNSYMLKFYSTDEKLGGPGVRVEIDESLFGKSKKTKNHSARPAANGKWVVGMVEVREGAPKRYRFEICEENKRNMNELRRIVHRHCKPGSTFVTDGWKGYLFIQPENFGRHVIVNHKVGFVDKATGEHTNNIEGTWKHAKEDRKLGGFKNEYLELYLNEFIFRKLNKSDRFDAFIKAIPQVYN